MPGVPLMHGGQALGTLCVIDVEPRAWSYDEIETLKDLAACVMREIELRDAAAGSGERHAARGGDAAAIVIKRYHDSPVLLSCSRIARRNDSCADSRRGHHLTFR